MKRVSTQLLCVFLFGVLGCVVALGQGSTAQISGTVTDSTGAVLPGVEITATQTETAGARTAISNETGSYVLPNLPVGPYRLEATLPGFRSFVQTGIILQVNSNPAIRIVLQVGQVSQTVEVQANAAQVETRNVGVSQVIETQRILELPLDGRQVENLITLSGAAVSTGTTNAGGARAVGGGDGAARGVTACTVADPAPGVIIKDAPTQSARRRDRSRTWFDTLRLARRVRAVAERDALRRS